MTYGDNVRCLYQRISPANEETLTFFVQRQNQSISDKIKGIFIYMWDSYH